MRRLLAAPTVGNASRDDEEGGRDGGRDDAGRPQGFAEIYERVPDLLGVEEPAGGIFHLAGPSPYGGWRVIGVWESEKDARAVLRERLRPAVEAVGPPTLPRPQFWPVHECVA